MQERFQAAFSEFGARCSGDRRRHQQFLSRAVNLWTNRLTVAIARKLMIVFKTFSNMARV
jgi:hypothetical protein